jgi:hypothetical protein
LSGRKSGMKEEINVKGLELKAIRYGSVKEVDAVAASFGTDTYIFNKNPKGSVLIYRILGERFFMVKIDHIRIIRGI